MTGVDEDVRRIAEAARDAIPVLVAASDRLIDDALEGIARGLEAERTGILAANAEDVTSSEGHLAPGLIDRLRLDEPRLSAMADQVRAVISLPPLSRVVNTWARDEGLRIQERRVPIGVVGAIYEARPNVTIDIATQLLKSRNGGVLRTGRSSLLTASTMVDTVIRPALDGAGLGPESIGLVRSPEHEAADALVSMPDLVPLVIIRGSGGTTKRLAGIAASAGVRTLQHADGGGFIYVHPEADLDLAKRLVLSSLDRLGVCNRLNWLAVDDAIYDDFLPDVLETLARLGVSASLAPHDHPLEHEWAADPSQNAVVTVLRVNGIREALDFAHSRTSGLAAAIVSDSEAAAGAFLDGYRGTGGFWNASTRWLDGYKLTGAPETGISVDRVPGPRGPVTYRDLYLRQFVVIGNGPAGR